jgi:hypothetical protein
MGRCWLFLRGFLPPQQPQQPFDVVREGSNGLSHRPDPIQPQGIDRHAPQSRQDLDAVVFPIAVGVFTQRHATHPVPAVFDRPAVSDVP